MKTKTDRQMTTQATTLNYDFSDLFEVELPKTKAEFFENGIRWQDAPHVLVPSMSGGNLNKALSSEEEITEYMVEFVKRFPTVESIFYYQHIYERALLSF
jgi:hypothetical protein